MLDGTTQRQCGLTRKLAAQSARRRHAAHPATRVSTSSASIAHDQAARRLSRSALRRAAHDTCSAPWRRPRPPAKAAQCPAWRVRSVSASPASPSTFLAAHRRHVVRGGGNAVRIRVPLRRPRTRRRGAREAINTRVDSIRRRHRQLPAESRWSLRANTRSRAEQSLLRLAQQLIGTKSIAARSVSIPPSTTPTPTRQHLEAPVDAPRAHREVIVGTRVAASSIASGTPLQAATYSCHCGLVRR